LSEDVDAVVIGTAMRMGSPTLPELVNRLVSEKGMKPKTASKAVYTLWKKGKLELLEPNPPSTVLSYALSPESIWFWFVTALVVLAIPLILLAYNPPLIYLRYVLGAIFVLYLPGSMLIEALYAKAKDLDGLERVALSIGLSLAVVPLIGLVLNFTPWGIRLDPIMVSLALFTEIMAAASLVRKFSYYRLGIGEIRRP
jgi:hypothetical protein